MRDGPTFDRRTILETTGALAAGSLFASTAASAGHEASNDEVEYETTHGVSEPEYELGAPEHFYAPTEFDHEGETESPDLYGEVVRPVDPDTGDVVEDVPVILTYSPYNDLRSPNRQTPDALKLSGYDYFAEAPEAADQSGEYTFGPVEYSPDGGNTWLTLSGTTEVNRVLGTGLPNLSESR